MAPIRDEKGRFVSVKHYDNNLIRAINDWNEQFVEPEIENQDALVPIRSAAELILILVLCILGIVATVYWLVRI
jgi:hypothetical protein